jgi:integrase
MRWEELDLDRSLWSMPGVRTKNKHPHTVPLSAEAVELLRFVEHRKDAEFVFEGPRQTAVSGFGKLKLRLTKALDEALKPTGRASVPWVIHDLRRTLATGFQKLGVRLEVTEAVLNHVSGSRSGIVGVYQRHGWDREKAETLKSWTAHVIGVANGKAEGDNVIQLRLGT